MPKSTIPLLHHQQERGKEYLQAFLGQRRVGVMARKHNQEASHLGQRRRVWENHLEVLCGRKKIGSWNVLLTPLTSSLSITT